MEIKLKGKKGDLQSFLIGIVIIFTLILSSIIFSKIFISALDELKQQKEFSNNTINTIEKVQTKTIPFLDFLIFFSFISIIIGLIISSIYIDVHPAILILFIIGLIIIIFLGGIFSNVYHEFKSEQELSSTASQFSLTNTIFDKHFPLILTVIGIIIIVILYGKTRNRGGYEI